MGKKAVIRNGRIVYDVDADQTLPSETAARENREKMRTKNRKDLLQKNQMDYWKAYPERAKELSPELRRLLT